MTTLNIAEQVVEVLDKDEARAYLAKILVILYGERDDGIESLNPLKECGADELGELCLLLDPLIPVRAHAVPEHT